MVANKPAHTLLGLLICAVGVAGVMGQWISPSLSLVFCAIAVIGALWASVIGHAGMVFLAILLGAPTWVFEQLDPRHPAKLKRRARREGVSAVSMRDIRYYGVKCGHQFKYRVDADGVLRVMDEGLREDWGGVRYQDVFGAGRGQALVYDFDPDTDEWRRILEQPWIQVA